MPARLPADMVGARGDQLAGSVHPFAAIAIRAVPDLTSDFPPNAPPM